MAITNNIGMLLLAIFLILWGISNIIALGIPAIVFGILALLSGIFTIDN